MKFVIIHGAFGSPEGNWFPELKEKLEALGQEVICVQFPVEKWNEVTKNGPSVEPKNQSLDNWLKTFENEVLPKIKKDEKLCFIGHSLGPVFILHVVEKYNLQLDSAIFVSPLNDPYVPQNRATAFIKALKSTSILVKGAGHMNEEIHYKPSLIFELCKTKIDFSVYNK